LKGRTSVALSGAKGVVERATIRANGVSEDIPLNGRERGEGFLDLFSISA